MNAVTLTEAAAIDRIAMLQEQIERLHAGRIKEIEDELLQLKIDAMVRAGVPLPTRHSRIAKLVDAAAVIFRVPAAAITGPGRDRDTCRARFAVAWVAREAYGASTTIIGKALGDRDHSTIVSALRRAVQWRAEDEDFRLGTEALLALYMPKAQHEEEAENAPSSH